MNVINFMASATPMFPAHLRKSPPTLTSLAQRDLVKYLTDFARSEKGFYQTYRQSVRDHLKSHLPADLQNQILSSLLSFRDPWRYPCLQEGGRLKCKAHSECKRMYSRCSQLLQLLFTSSTRSLRLNFLKIRRDDHERVFRDLSHLIRGPSLPKGSTYVNHITILILKGGTIHTDVLGYKVEDLCSLLSIHAPKLEELHLPICSNFALRSVSDIKALKSLRSDRTRYFNRRGLWHLCHPRSQSKYKLEVLHLGVLEHRHFNKLDVSEFFSCMRNLKSFSLMDEDRPLVSDGNHHLFSRERKVRAYSVLKLAIVEGDQRKRRSSGSGNGSGSGESKRFCCSLEDIKIVDKSFKAQYLLDSCPQLNKLYIDWQEELAMPPFRFFDPDWFTKIVLNQKFQQLCSQLIELDIVFPSAHSPNNYSLPLSDFSRLFYHLGRLERLRLVGAGKQSPIPLLHVLKFCPLLKNLILEKTAVHVPDNFEVIDANSIHCNLTSFHFLGDMSSLLFNQFLTKCLTHYMPELVELEIQPETVLGYRGMTPSQMREFSVLKRLDKLSIPLSMQACIMNMPELIFVLREFQCLTHLELSWARWCNSYDISNNRIPYMMNWLFGALGAENANIYLQLSYKMHPKMFSSS